MIFILVGYVKIYGINETEKAINLAKNIMQTVDQNNSGFIDYSEFLIAAQHENKLHNVSKIKNAFQMFDLVILPKI